MCVCVRFEHGEVKKGLELCSLLAEKGQQQTQATTTGKRLLEKLIIKFNFFKYIPSPTLTHSREEGNPPPPPSGGISYIKPEMVRMKYKNTIYKRGKRVTFRHPHPRAPSAPLKKAPGNPFACRIRPSSGGVLKPQHGIGSSEIN